MFDNPPKAIGEITLIAGHDSRGIQFPRDGLPPTASIFPRFGRSNLAIAQDALLDLAPEAIVPYAVLICGGQPHPKLISVGLVRVRPVQARLRLGVQVITHDAPQHECQNSSPNPAAHEDHAFNCQSPITDKLTCIAWFRGLILIIVCCIT